MNCTTANRIPITHIMKSIYQCDPDQVRGDEAIYKARNERTASLFVNREKNIWKDFGSGRGGRAVDLVCELSGVSLSGALLILSGVQPATIDSLSFSQPEHEPQFEINHIQPLQNAALIQYLQSRKIPYQIAAKVPQLKEAYYTVNNKRFFALAFENNSNNYELRSKYFKGCTGKDITTIQGPGTGLNLFEGFMDYLSALTFFPKKSTNTTIVLNSLVNLDKVDLTRYELINIWLDNDEPGIKAAAEIINQHPAAVNRSKQFYRHHKDFNDYLLTI